MSALSDQIRKMFGEGDAKRDAGLVFPEDIKAFRDIRYGEDAEWNVLDVYRPKDAEGKLPVIISIHGGGWVYGDKNVYQFYCSSLAQRGFAVVNFSYRLAPENKFPSSLEDTNAVCAWVMENAEEYGFDTGHIFAVGDSAGAHNLSLYACILTNPEYAKQYPFQAPEGFELKACALNCGVYNISADTFDPMTGGLMNDLIEGALTPEKLAFISCVNYVTDAFPPAYIMTANQDFLKAEPAKLVPVLFSHEIPFIFRNFGTKENPLGHVFHCNMRLEAAAVCNDEECAFFKEFL